MLHWTLQCYTAFYFIMCIMYLGISLAYKKIVGKSTIHHSKSCLLCPANSPKTPNTVYSVCYRKQKRQQIFPSQRWGELLKKDLKGWSTFVMVQCKSFFCRFDEFICNQTKFLRQVNYDQHFLNICSDPSLLLPQNCIQKINDHIVFLCWYFKWLNRPQRSAVQKQ